MSNQNTNNQNFIAHQSEQIFSSDILLGTLLRVTGLSIIDVQNIVRGLIIPVKTSTQIRNYIYENSIFNTTFTEKILMYGLNIEEICKCLDLKGSYTKEILQENIYNFSFPLNFQNFSLNQMKDRREKLILLLSDSKKCGKKLTTKDIVFLLSINPNLIYQAKRRNSQKRK